MFDTPTGKPVFGDTLLARGAVAREVLITLAEASVRFELPQLGEKSRLLFGLSMFFDTGDGAEGRIYFESDGRHELIYSRYLNTARNAADRRWVDASVDLGRFAGCRGAVILQSRSGPRRDASADWLAWSILKITLP